MSATKNQTIETSPADKVKLTGAFLLVVLGVVGFYMLSEQPLFVRVLSVIAGVVAGAAVALMTTPGQASWSFATSARTEVRKVVWPSKRETIQSTLIVIVMVIFVGLLLWVIDSIAFYAIYDLLLNLKS